MGAIYYRIGTHPTFLRAMLLRLGTQTVPPSATDGKRPLANLTTRHANDPAIALLDAWAVVLDVLSFYQERIANEGYLQTAIERRSVIELARTIGYELHPGVAASTVLAFTVESAAGAPAEVVVPVGTQVQSIPAQGQQPQTFETIAAITARADWNSLTLHLPVVTQFQAIAPDTHQLDFDGTVSLAPGDRILLTDAETAIACRLDTVTPQDEITRVTWTPEEQGVIARPQAFTLQPPLRLFGYRAPAWQEMPQDTQQQFSPDTGGVFQLSEGSSDWVAVANGLKNRDVRGLVALEHHGRQWILAGTDRGLFRADAAEMQWTSLHMGLTTIDIHALTVSDGVLFAGGAGGSVFRSTDGGDSWVAIGVGSVTILEHRLPLNAYGSDNLSPTAKRFERWTPISTSLPNSVVRSLLVAQTQLYAGTDDGIYRSIDSGKSWIALNAGLSNTNAETGLTTTATFALAAYQDGNTHFILAGTDRGLFFRSEDTNWTAIGPDQTIRAIVLSSTANRLLVGGDRGLFFLERRDDAWQMERVFDQAVRAIAVSNRLGVIVTNQGVSRLNGAEVEPPLTGLPNADIRCVTLLSNRILMGSFFTGHSAADWPGFILTNAQIDLDGTAAIAPRSWIVLSNGDRQQAYRVEQVTTATRTDFLQTAIVTRLRLHSDRNLADFGGQNLRGTLIFAQGERLPLIEAQVRQRFASIETPVTEITLTQTVLGLQPNQPIALSGKLARLRLTRSQTLQTLNGGEIALQPGDRLQLFAPPASTGIGWLWTVMTQFGDRGYMIALEEAIVLEPALEGDASVSEMVTIVQIAQDGDRQHLVLTLDQPLQHLYDLATVTINANVAPSTQGETIIDEVLGSGDSTIANQQFVLKQPPLTYISATTPSGIASSLVIRVNQVVWQEVPSLYGLAASSQSYTVHRDEENRSIVTFGDGVSGARLPSGIENITATYRTSSGRAGEVAANQLTLLQTQPLGIRSVTNLLPATGAADPEAHDSIRQRIPLEVRSLGRIVSLQDFEDFSRSFAGIGKAQAVLLKAFAPRQRDQIHITIAAANGDSVDSSSALYTNLSQAIAAARDPAQSRQRTIAAQVKIDSYDRRWFELEAIVWAEGRSRGETVLAAIQAALLDQFSFERRSFGQPVTAAEVTSVMQAIAGVVSVHLKGLDLAPSDRLQSVLLANSARWSAIDANLPTPIEPAELLLINPNLRGTIVQTSSNLTQLHLSTNRF